MNRLSRRLFLSLSLSRSLSLDAELILNQLSPDEIFIAIFPSCRRNYASGPTISTVTETIPVPRKGRRERKEKEREIDTEA